MWYAWFEAQRNLLRVAGALGWPLAGGHDSLAQPLPPIPPLPVPRPVPGFDIRAVLCDGHAVPVIERIADRTPFCTLRHFACEPHACTPARRAAASILLCAPLAGHHAVMLRETVETLLASGDVYLTDWTDARDVPLADGLFGLDDCVLTVGRFLHAIGDARTHVVGVCQGAVPALAALALAADAGAQSAAQSAASITLMGGPIDARIHPGALARFAQSTGIASLRSAFIDVVPPPYPGAGRRVYPGFYQQAAMLGAFAQHRLALEAGYWSSRLAGDRDAIARSLRGLGEYAAVLDMDERYFLDTIRIVFQEQRLARGTWRIGERAVRLRALASMPLCTVEGERDSITGAGQTHVAHALCGMRAKPPRLTLTIPACDHYGLFSGEPWRRAIYPALVQFWRALPERPGRAPMRARARSAARHVPPPPP